MKRIHGFVSVTVGSGLSCSIVIGSLNTVKVSLTVPWIPAWWHRWQNPPRQTLFSLSLRQAKARLQEKRLWLRTCFCSFIKNKTKSSFMWIQAEVEQHDCGRTWQIWLMLEHSAVLHNPSLSARVPAAPSADLNSPEQTMRSFDESLSPCDCSSADPIIRTVNKQGSPAPTLTHTHDLNSSARRKPYVYYAVYWNTFLMRHNIMSGFFFLC